MVWLSILYWDPYIPKSPRPAPPASPSKTPRSTPIEQEPVRRPRPKNGLELTFDGKVKIPGLAELDPNILVDEGIRGRALRVSREIRFPRVTSEWGKTFDLGFWFKVEPEVLETGIPSLRILGFHGGVVELDGSRSLRLVLRGRKFDKFFAAMGDSQVGKVQPGQWHHVAIRRESEDVDPEAWVDGATLSRILLPQQAETWMDSPPIDSDLVLGDARASVERSFLLDELRIFESRIPAEEIPTATSSPAGESFPGRAKGGAEETATREKPRFPCPRKVSDQIEVKDLPPWRVFLFRGHLKRLKPTCLEDHGDDLWLGTDQWLVRFRQASETWETYDRDSEIPRHGIMALAAGEDRVAVSFGESFWFPFVQTLDLDTCTWNEVKGLNWIGAHLLWDGDTLWGANVVLSRSSGRTSERVDFPAFDLGPDRLNFGPLVSCSHNAHKTPGKRKPTTGKVAPRPPVGFWITALGSDDPKAKGNFVLSRFHPDTESWENFFRNSGENFPGICDLAGDDKEVWLPPLEEKGVIWRFRKNKQEWTRVPLQVPKGNPSTATVVHLALDGRACWVGLPKDGGLIRIDRKTLAQTHFPFPAGFEDRRIAGLSATSEGIWVAVAPESFRLSGGLLKLSPDTGD